MIVFPHAKINLGLHITGKRSDGYHDLQTVFYPLPLRDALEVLPSAKDEFTCTGLPVQGEPQNNLVQRACQLLKTDFPQLPALRIHLHKAIPMGAGLGGGSSDAASMLLLLNEKFSLGLGEEELFGYALQLGSDCPFFIRPRPSFAEGRGEILSPLSLDLSAYRFVVINPGIHVSTALAFQWVKPRLPDEDLRDLVQLPPTQWKDRLINDFQEPVCRQFPDIAALIESLESTGALYVSLSGSGSSVYAVYPADVTPVLPALPAHYQVYNV